MDDKLLKEALISTFDKKFEFTDTELEDIPEHKFSRKFEKKMDKLIKTRNKRIFPLVSTTTRRVACILVVVTAFAISTLSVDAVREQFKNFYINIFHDHSEISIHTDGTISDISKIDIESLEANIPEGFELVESSDGEMMKLREYWCGDEYILIRVSYNENSNILVDNDQEDYETYYDDKDNEYMVNYSDDGRQIIIYWINENCMYRIFSTLEKNEIFEILE